MGRLKNAKSGEAWCINDKRTSGHTSIILSHNKAQRKKGEVIHSPITHAEKTRGEKNIELKENPDKLNSKQNEKPSHILAIAQVSKEKTKAKKREGFSIKNPVDKSIKRHIKKLAIKKKRRQQGDR